MAKDDIQGRGDGTFNLNDNNNRNNNQVPSNLIPTSNSNSSNSTSNSTARGSVNSEAQSSTSNNNTAPSETPNGPAAPGQGIVPSGSGGSLAPEPARNHKIQTIRESSCDSPWNHIDAETHLRATPSSAAHASIHAPTEDGRVTYGQASYNNSLQAYGPSSASRVANSTLIVLILGVILTTAILEGCVALYVKLSDQATFNALTAVNLFGRATHPEASANEAFSRMADQVDTSKIHLNFSIDSNFGNVAKLVTEKSNGIPVYSGLVNPQFAGPSHLIEAVGIEANEVIKDMEDMKLNGGSDEIGQMNQNNIDGMGEGEKAIDGEGMEMNVDERENMEVVREDDQVVKNNLEDMEDDEDMEEEIVTTGRGSLSGAANRRVSAASTEDSPEILGFQAHPDGYRRSSRKSIESVPGPVILSVAASASGSRTRQSKGSGSGSKKSGSVSAKFKNAKNAILGRPKDGKANRQNAGNQDQSLSYVDVQMEDAQEGGVPLEVDNVNKASSNPKQRKRKV